MDCKSKYTKWINKAIKLNDKILSDLPEDLIKSIKELVEAHKIAAYFRGRDSVNENLMCCGNCGRPDDVIGEEDGINKEEWCPYNRNGVLPGDCCPKWEWDCMAKKDRDVFSKQLKGEI